MFWSDYWLNIGIVDFPSYLLGVIVVVLLPGPNSLYVLTITVQRGWKAGLWGSLGIFLGDTVLMLSVSLGAASLFSSSPIAFAFVRYAGMAYLVWLGLGLIKAGALRWKKSVKNLSGANSSLSKIDGNVTAVRLIRFHPFVAALILSLTNPKAIFFFISFFSQFIDPNFNRPGISFFYLALVLQIISMSYLSVLVSAGQLLLKLFQSHQRWSAMLWIGVGMLFIAFSLRLLAL